MKIKNISKTYNIKNGKKVTALKGISFDLPSSGMVFILGKSGSGKTTLLNILSGLDSFDDGDIECFGKHMKDFSHKELDYYRNSCCGFVFQEYNLIPELDVGDNIALALQLQGQKEDAEQIRSVLQQVDLAGYENRKINELSGGQKQRVAIARALVKDPKIIFADEPTGALDFQTGESILKILKTVAENKLIVMVTHDREFAEKYADRIIELSDGKVIRDSDRSFQFREAEPEMKLKKSMLPIKTALKIGCSNFKYHPIRLVSTILLSVIAFSLLGISLTISFLNPADVFCDAILRDGMEYTAIYKTHWYEPQNVKDESLDRFLGADTRMKEEACVSLEDIKDLKSAVGNSYTLVYKADIFSFQKSIAATSNQINEALKKSEKDYSISADGYIAMTEEECENHGFTVIGSLPKNSSEIAINECIFNTFSIEGLIEDNQKFEISSENDVIGHKISVIHNTSLDSYKTITGVVVTGCDQKCAANHWKKESYHEKIFVSEDYFDEYTYALCPIPQDKPELKKLVNYVLEYNENDYTFAFVNKLSDGFYTSYYIVSMLKMLCIYLSIIFLFFALLLLSNFIFTSMRRQMKQIGILSALGTDFKDLCKIYGSAVVIVCCAVTAVTLIVLGFGINLLNGYLKNSSHALFDLVPVSPLAIVLSILMIAVVAAAGCFLPLVRLRKIDPTTIINKGQIK